MSDISKLKAFLRLNDRQKLDDLFYMERTQGVKMIPFNVIYYANMYFAQYLMFDETEDRCFFMMEYIVRPIGFELFDITDLINAYHE